MNHRGPVPARVLLTVSHPDGLTLHANAKLGRIVCYQISESVEEGHGASTRTRGESQNGKYYLAPAI